MPVVTLSIMIQDGSNQHELAHAWDFYDLAAKPDASEAMAASMVKLFNELAQQVDDSVQLAEPSLHTSSLVTQRQKLIEKLETNLDQYKTVVRDQSGQIARQQGEIVRLESQLKLLQPPNQFEELGKKATAYCEAHGCKTVDLDTVRAWDPLATPKTDMIRAAAEAAGLTVIDIPLSPAASAADLRGIPTKPVKPGFEGLIKGK